MSMLFNCIAVGAGGAFGAVGRYLLGLVPVKTDSGFPVMTLCVNVIGAFFIGLIVGLAGKNTGFDPRLLLFLKIGVCGGFTTFSAFSFEALGLLQRGQHVTAIIYMSLSVILCLAAAAGAQALVR
jgi:CrcB protein